MRTTATRAAPGSISNSSSCGLSGGRRPKRSTVVLALWLTLFAAILLVRNTKCLSTLRHKFRRWNVRRSRRIIRRLRVDMDTLIASRNNEIDICFVSSIFGEDADNADRPGDVSTVWLDDNFARPVQTTFRFFLFTNLKDMKVSEGWTKVVKTDEDLPYRRFITKSRWPKFMGWQDAQLQGCQTIFYFDGHFQVNPDKMHEFPRVAQDIQASDTGLAQAVHPQRRTALREFSQILYKRKDIPPNVEASVLWLQSQPDFDNRCTMYINAFFGYNPRHPTWQAAVEFFWNRYSLEIDSWRDQPLWCYTLQHVGLTEPMPLKNEPHGLFQKDRQRIGHNDHQYDEHADGKKEEDQTEQNEGAPSTSLSATAVGVDTT